MCDCASEDYVKISTLVLPNLMDPHDPEVSECYSAYTAAYYAAISAFWAVINAHLDPTCSECVEAAYGTPAYIAVNLAVAEAEVAYWKCRSQHA